jgi:hypothetical protein
MYITDMFYILLDCVMYLQVLFLFFMFGVLNLDKFGKHVYQN